jgi:hypothetical protein
MIEPSGFRRIALGLKVTLESAHMGHADFRINGRIFAGLKSDPAWGMVALTPEQQQEFTGDHPKTFVPESGAWGLAGYTKVHLPTADEDTVGRALTLARENAIGKSARNSSGKKPTRKKAIF